MTTNEVIKQLEDLESHCNDQKGEPGDSWYKDIEALEIAIKTIKAGGTIE